MYSSLSIYKVAPAPQAMGPMALGCVSRVEKLPKTLISWRMPVGRDRKWNGNRLWSIGFLPRPPAPDCRSVQGRKCSFLMCMGH